MILGNLNSCVNPWVYILFNRSQAVKALCGRRAMGSFGLEGLAHFAPPSDSLVYSRLLHAPQRNRCAINQPAVWAQTLARKFIGTARNWPNEGTSINYLFSNLGTFSSNRCERQWRRWTEQKSLFFQVHRNVSFQEPSKHRPFRDTSPGTDLPTRKRAPASLYAKRSTAAFLCDKSPTSNGYRIVLSTDSPPTPSTPHFANKTDKIPIFSN